MNQLALLQSRLSGLAARRRLVRGGSALLLTLAVLVSGLLLCFVVDWSWQPGWTGRLLMLCSYAMVAVWLIVSTLWPALRQTDSLEQVALDVEREHRIDTDLIAALQFSRSSLSSARLATAGTSEQHLPAVSAQLSGAVIDYVAEFTPSLDVARGFSWKPLPARLGVLLLILLLGGSVVASAPQHAKVFWQRFWLGQARYPTRTVIDRLSLNDRDYPVFSASEQRDSGQRLFALAAGLPLAIQLSVSGETPAAVTAEFQRTGEPGWQVTTLTQTDTTGRDYEVTLPPMPGPGKLSLRAGDAAADLIQIDVIPLPVLDAVWTVRPPTYIAGSESAAQQLSSGQRQWSVLAGSAISLELRCLNKSLRSAELLLTDTEGGVTVYPLQPLTGTSAERSPETWRPAGASVLNALKHPLEFEIRAVDRDGLSPQTPLTGQIRLQVDRVPRAVAAVVSRKVLPTAQPKLNYGATDDLGLRQISLEVQVRRASGQTEQHRVPLADLATQFPRVKAHRAEIAISLAPWQLAKGDEVSLQVLAEDERGELESQIGRSEPLVLEVTDRSGILAGLLEADQQSARQLDAIIQRELGIGGGQ